MAAYKFDVWWPTFVFFSHCTQLGLQSEADKFFIYLAALILVTLVSAALAIALRAASPSLDVAMGLLCHAWYPFILLLSFFFLIPVFVELALLPGAFIPFTIFSGFLVSEDSVPDAVAWIKYFSFFKYGFQILAINEFKDQEFTCSAGETCSFTSELILSNYYIHLPRPKSLCGHLLNQSPFPVCFFFF